MRRPRASGEVSFFLVFGDRVTLCEPVSYNLDVLEIVHVCAIEGDDPFLHKRLCIMKDLTYLKSVEALAEI